MMMSINETEPRFAREFSPFSAARCTSPSGYLPRLEDFRVQVLQLYARAK